MDYNLDIQKLLLKKDNAPLPADRINFIKQAINIADAHNDMQWGYDLRYDLINEESNTANCIDSFPAFAWMLNAYDNDPEIFSVELILGKYRWMINESFFNINVSMAQLQQMLVDFKMRLQDNGYSLRTYYLTKADLGFFLYDIKMIEENLGLSCDEEVNHDFDDWISEMYADLEFSLRKNNFEAAAQIERKLSLHNMTYSYYPLIIYSSFVRHYTRTKKYDLANNYFTKAEESLANMGNDQSILTPVSKLIQFLSVYNKPRAWKFFEQYVNLTLNCDDCTKVFFVMDVINLLKDKGTKILHVDPQLPWYRSDNTYNVADLYQYYYNMGSHLIKRFDERNGSNSYARQLKLSLQIGSRNWFSSILNKLFNK